MANLVVVKTGSSIIVTFNVYATEIGSVKRSYHTDNLTEIDLKSDRVELYMAITHEHWQLTYDAAYAGTDLYIVDSIDGVAPTSESDLFDKLTALR